MKRRGNTEFSNGEGMDTRTVGLWGSEGRAPTLKRSINTKKFMLSSVILKDQPIL